VLQARKPYLLNLPLTDKRHKYFSTDPTSVFNFLLWYNCLLITDHLQNVVQKKKKPRWMMSSLLQYTIIRINRDRKKKLKHKILWSLWRMQFWSAAHNVLVVLTILKCSTQCIGTTYHF